LEHFGLAKRPLLFLSVYLRWHRYEYLERLGFVRTRGDWEGWLLYFLEGVKTIAEQSFALAVELSKRVAADRVLLLGDANSPLPALRLFEALPRHPLVSVRFARERLGLDESTARGAIDALERM